VNGMDQLMIIYIVLDVLKLHQPNLPDFAVFIKELEGIEKVDVNVIEIDDKTESIKVIIEGIIDYKSISAHMIKVGAEIKSVDQVVVGHARE